MSKQSDREFVEGFGFTDARFTDAEIEFIRTQWNATVLAAQVVLLMRRVAALEAK